MLSSPSLRICILRQAVELLFYRWGTSRKADQTSSILSSHLRLDHPSVVRETLGNSGRVTTLPVSIPHAVGTSKKTKLCPRATTLSVETSSAEGDSTCNENFNSKFLALPDSYTPPRILNTMLSSSFSSYQTTLPPTLESKSALRDLLSPSSASVYCAPPHTPPKPPHCLLCFRSVRCAALISEDLQDRLIHVPEKNVHPRQTERQC